jgi:hypothetical protein
MMNKIESVQKLGNAIGRTIGEIYNARLEGMETTVRNLSVVLQCLIDVAEGLVRSRAPLVKVYAALAPLPGGPKFETAWNYTDDEFRDGKIFVDKRERSDIRATNDAAQLIIRFVVEQIRQIVKERDQRNGTRR